VVHNAVDTDLFRIDGEPAAGRPYLLCVGWDGNEFKGMDDVRRLWARLRRERPELDLVWVTPRAPRQEMGRVFVTPSQPELAALYRGASVYLCASRYESFPLPPLEAMACGAPVVTTSNVGVLEYARDGENALVVPVGDVDQMAASIYRILDDRALATRLRASGARTASSFSWERIITGLETRYRDVARWRLAGPDDPEWEPMLPTAAEASPGGRGPRSRQLGVDRATAVRPRHGQDPRTSPRRCARLDSTSGTDRRTRCRAARGCPRDLHELSAGDP
jgi:L-malate glycosyltransferase